MRATAITAIAFATLMLTSFGAVADEVFEVYADSTMDGNAGSLLRT